MQDKAQFDATCARQILAELIDTVQLLPIPDSNWHKCWQGQRYAKSLDVARIVLMRSGSQKYGISLDGQEHSVRIPAASALYFPPHAWMLEHWQQRCEFIGLVFRQEYLRLFLYTHPGGPDSVGLTHVVHTMHPVGNAGKHCCLALDTLTGVEQDGELRNDLFRALLRSCCEHLLKDQAHTADSSHKLTWQRLQEYLDEHFHLPINRNDTAVALAVHPNYLSTLCTRESGLGFTALLRQRRMQRAEHLLRHSTLRIHEIASACGYAQADYFSKVVKRHFGKNPQDFR